MSIIRLLIKYCIYLYPETSLSIVYNKYLPSTFNVLSLKLKMASVFVDLIYLALPGSSPSELITTTDQKGGHFRTLS